MVSISKVDFIHPFPNSSVTISRISSASPLKSGLFTPDINLCNTFPNSPIWDGTFESTAHRHGFKILPRLPTV